jgi:hypothetical protein
MKFVSGYCKGLEVNHLDEDKTNNAASNLEWTTRQKNMTHGTLVKRAAVKKSLPIKQMDTTGIVLKIWQSGKDAERAGFTNVNKCLKGRIATCGGFHWQYA